MSRCPHAAHGRSVATEPAAAEPAPATAAAPTAAPGVGEDDFCCPVCLRLLHEPTTLPCGHTFCRPCLRSAELTARLAGGCPVCRAEAPEGGHRALRSNVLLSALIEKYLPEAAMRRRKEAEQESEEDRQLHTMIRRLTLSVDCGTSGGGHEASVKLQMEGASRCPMHAGVRIPIGFYVARAVARFPTGWSPSEAEFRAAGTHALERDAWVLMSSPSAGAAEDAAGDADGPMVSVELHFQPRFQLPPSSERLRLRQGEVAHVELQLDVRAVHK